MFISIYPKLYVAYFKRFILSFSYLVTDFVDRLFVSASNMA